MARAGHLNRRRTSSGPRQPRLNISPRIAGIIGCAVTAVLAYGPITVIDQGRTAVRDQWRLAVTVGGCVSIGLIAILAAALAVARSRHRFPPYLARVLAALAGALLLITVAGLRIIDTGSPPTSAWEVGLAAFVVPVAGLALVLIPLATWRRKAPDGTGNRKIDAS
jgi:drug/metabolite transporter (DMT)-like permease